MWSDVSFLVYSVTVMVQYVMLTIIGQCVELNVETTNVVGKSGTEV